MIKLFVCPNCKQESTHVFKYVRVNTSQFSEYSLRLYNVNTEQDYGTILYEKKLHLEVDECYKCVPCGYFIGTFDDLNRCIVKREK